MIDRPEAEWREKLLLAGALHSAVFAVFHLLFPRLFHWTTELSRLHPVNRGIMQVLNLCLTYFFVGVGILFAVHRSEILSTRLGTQFLVLLSGFWAFRLILQFVWFPARHWTSWALSALFLAGAVLYGLLAWTA